MKKYFFQTALLTTLIFSTSLSQTTYDFLRVDMSARASALGGSFVSNHDDVDVLFYNPAGMALLEDSPVSLSFVKHLLDINLFSLAYSTEFENIGRFGTAIKYINYGTFDAADEFGNRNGEFNAGEFALAIGYAGEFEENFYYGVNAKVIYSSIAEHSSSALAADIGIHYTIPSQQLNIAASVLNLGKQISSYINTEEDLPLDIVVGVSKRLENLPVRLSLDFHRLNEDRDEFYQRFKGFSIGAEFYMSKVLNLRLGYDNERRSELKVGTTSGIAGFNAGLGVLISDYQFNYGYSSLGLIGAMHRIGISTTF
jgi:long-subunit fatty acid transport protein